MRFALIATSVIAAAASPFVADAVGPKMSGDQFIAAARCTALVQETRPELDLSAERLRLNLEARRQPVETTAAARAEVLAVRSGGIANSAEASMVPAERVSACGGVDMAAGQAGSTV
ncbi:hypothetical protein U91I_03621 [alpha proteobacterium U9-1i]|nr:hypothetical protein U91I_03621 [alpha proteobacterium U9-1i]